MYKNSVRLDKWSLKLTQMLTTTPAIWLAAHDEKACNPALDRSQTCDVLIMSLCGRGQFFVVFCDGVLIST